MRTQSDSNNAPTDIPMDGKTQQVVAVNNNNEDHHEECERVFEESTHYYLIYGEDWNMWILALFVIIIQFILYGIIIAQGWGDFDDDQVSVNVSFNECADSDGKLTSGIISALKSNSTASLNWLQENYYYYPLPELVCEADYDKSTGAVYLAMILAAIFLQYDYLASIKVLILDNRNNGKKCCRWSRFAAFLILLEAILATHACAVFAFNGWYNGSVYDAIMNTVGVLFIHDIDEKVYESVGIIEPNDTRFKICGVIGEFLRKSMKSWLTFIFILIIAFVSSQIMFIEAFE